MSCISNNSIKHQSFVYTRLNDRTVLFQTIQLSKSTQFSSVCPIDRTLSGATTPGQSGPGNNDNKGVLCIPPNSSITEASPSNCLVSYPGHSLRESYPFAEMQSVYSAASTERAIITKGVADYPLRKTFKVTLKKTSKVGDCSRGRPEGSLFNSYYTEV